VRQPRIDVLENQSIVVENNDARSMDSPLPGESICNRFPLSNLIELEIGHWERSSASQERHSVHSGVPKGKIKHYDWADGTVAIRFAPAGVDRFPLCDKD
jgi:hypothetical protein